MTPWVKGQTNPNSCGSTTCSLTKDEHHLMHHNDLPHNSKKQQRNKVDAHDPFQDAQSKARDVCGLRISIPTLIARIFSKHRQQDTSWGATYYTQNYPGSNFLFRQRGTHDDCTFNSDQEAEGTTRVGRVVPLGLKAAQVGPAAELDAAESLTELDEFPLMHCDTEGDIKELGNTHSFDVSQDHPSSMEDASRKPRHYQHSIIAQLSNDSFNSDTPATTRLSRLSTHHSISSALRSPMSPGTATDFETSISTMSNAKRQHRKVLSASSDHYRSLLPEPLTMSPDGFGSLPFSESRDSSSPTSRSRGSSSPHMGLLPYQVQNVPQAGDSSAAWTNQATSLNPPVTLGQPCSRLRDASNPFSSLSRLETNFAMAHTGMVEPVTIPPTSFNSSTTPFRDSCNSTFAESRNRKQSVHASASAPTVASGVHGSDADFFVYDPSFVDMVSYSPNLSSNSHAILEIMATHHSRPYLQPQGTSITLEDDALHLESK